MNIPNAFEIAVVYYAGLSFSLLLGIIGMIFLSPKTAIARITGRANNLWGHNFRITFIFSLVLGALSVSFTGCKGGYPFGLDQTIQLGLDQISQASVCAATILTAWFIMFLTMRLLTIWRVKMRASHRIIAVILAIIPVGVFFLILFVNKRYG